MSETFEKRLEKYEPHGVSLQRVQAGQQAAFDARALTLVRYHGAPVGLLNGLMAAMLAHGVESSRLLSCLFDMLDELVHSSGTPQELSARLREVILATKHVDRHLDDLTKSVAEATRAMEGGKGGVH